MRPPCPAPRDKQHPETTDQTSKMVSFTAACKANHALVLPGLLAAGYANHGDGGVPVSITCEDVEFVGPNQEPLKLITEDGEFLYGDSIILHLRDNFSSLQVGHRDQVCTQLRCFIAKVY